MKTKLTKVEIEKKIVTILEDCETDDYNGAGEGYTYFSKDMATGALLKLLTELGVDFAKS